MFPSLKVRIFLFCFVLLFVLFAGIFSTATTDQKIFEVENMAFSPQKQWGHSQQLLYTSIYFKHTIYFSQIIKISFHVSSVLFYWGWFNIFLKKYAASFYDQYNFHKSEKAEWRDRLLERQCGILQLLQLWKYIVFVAGTNRQHPAKPFLEFFLW